MLPGDDGRSGKIQGRHLERLAVVYVRQSTVQQIQKHQESTRIQYGLVAVAESLGWPRERVLVIDEDLGVSGASAEGRAGFQRLLSEVALDHVGLILGVEMSRLARSCKDWYQLLELCAVYGTLIGDLDGLYDPSRYNDRLLLGLKGTMSEAELHILKQRMLQGKMAKARRGELGKLLPIGYVRRPSGEVVKDPDEGARGVVELIFDQFERLGTLHAVLRHLVIHGIRMGVREQCGPEKGELGWRRPNRMTLYNMLCNPAYAGAYAYGRRRIDPRRKKPGRPCTGRVVARFEEWEVCLKERLPAYISWEQYERNLARMAANRCRAAAQGAVREGTALLSGILECGRCGCRMLTQYGGRANRARYACLRGSVDYGEPRCQSLAAWALDAEVERLVLRALEPAALELSLAVREDMERERARLEEQWSLRLERIRYEADRAARQYRVVEPENRLVARTLETSWEEALRAQRGLEEDYERSLHEQPRVLTAEEQDAIRGLAADLPALWRAPTTTAADRKAIARQIVDRVVVTVEGDTEWTEVVVHWAGGRKTFRRVRRPVARLDQLSSYAALLDRAATLRHEGLPSGTIASTLNAEGWRPPKRRDTFNASMVRSLLYRRGLSPLRNLRDRELVLGPNEWSLPGLARELGVPEPTVFVWVRKGWIRARQIGGAQGRWILWMDGVERQRLAALRTRRRSWTDEQPVDAAPGTPKAEEAKV